MIGLLITIIVLFAIATLVMAIKYPKVIEISDVAPEENSPKNSWLKLQNEGCKYVHKENETVKLKIVK